MDKIKILAGIMVFGMLVVAIYMVISSSFPAEHAVGTSKFSISSPFKESGKLNTVNSSILELAYRQGRSSISETITITEYANQSAMEQEIRDKFTPTSVLYYENYKEKNTTLGGVNIRSFSGKGVRNYFFEKNGKYYSIAYTYWYSTTKDTVQRIIETLK